MIVLDHSWVVLFLGSRLSNDKCPYLQGCQYVSFLLPVVVSMLSFNKYIFVLESNLIPCLINWLLCFLRHTSYSYGEKRSVTHCTNMFHASMYHSVSWVDVRTSKCFCVFNTNWTWLCHYVCYNQFTLYCLQQLELHLTVSFCCRYRC